LEKKRIGDALLYDVVTARLLFPMRKKRARLISVEKGLPTCGEKAVGFSGAGKN